MNPHNEMIGPIAAFIGARLQYPSPECNGQGNKWVSTIRVDQHKEKFFYARVYCSLAAKDLVKEKWQWMRKNYEFLSKMRSHYVPDLALANAEETTDEEPSVSFIARCVKRDAIHYRQVYLDMVSLQPHLHDKICSQADHRELLFPSLLELLDCLDGLDGAQKLEYYYEKYHVDNVVSLKEFMTSVYAPSYKDMYQ